MSNVIGGQEDFYDVLEELKQKGEKFSPESLRRLAYDQLHFAAMGNAGASRCTVEEVLRERRERRALLLGVPPSRWTRLKLCSNMLEDLHSDKVKKDSNIPCWSDLTPLCQISFRLGCLEIHPHHPLSRVSEILNQIATYPDPNPDLQLCFTKMQTDLQSVLLSKPSTEWLRKMAGQYSLHLSSFLTERDTEILDGQSVRGYVCHAGCFRPLED